MFFDNMPWHMPRKEVFSAVVFRGLVLPNCGSSLNTRCQGCNTATFCERSVAGSVYWGSTNTVNQVTAGVKVL